MLIQYDTTMHTPEIAATDRYAPVQPTPPARPVPQESSSGGLGAAALVAMVFVVVGILFATIPTNEYFTNSGSPELIAPVAADPAMGDAATDAVIIAPEN